MTSRRKWLFLLLIVPAIAAVAVWFWFLRPARALELYYIHSTIEDFNAGYFYHTALSWLDDGEVQLLPIGLAHPWEPGNSTGLPPRAGLAAAYLNGHIYATGGYGSTQVPCSDARNEVFYTSVHSVTHELADWQPTTPLPTSIYPDGVRFHEAVAITVTQPGGGEAAYLYVLGGEEDDGAQSSIYDTVLFAPIQPDGSLGAWQSTTPLPQPLFGMEALAWHGRIYVIGGLMANGQSSAFVYYTTPNPDGTISSWSQTTALLPYTIGGKPHYYESAVALEHGRIYVIGGASGVLATTFSPYIFFGEPDPATGDITAWTPVYPEILPQNLFAGEGAAYQSGLLLTIAGAWNNFNTPTGDVLAALVDHETGQTGEWLYTIGMPQARYWHSVVQDEHGWLYAIGGATGYTGACLNQVAVASPYTGGGRQATAPLPALTATAETTGTIYAPDGVFTSAIMDVTQYGGTAAQLVKLAWNTTIPDPQAMTITLSYRYNRAGVWSPWSEPLPSRAPGTLTTTVPISITCNYFQYRAYFSTTVLTQTPYLNAVRLTVLAPPDLVADRLTITGCPSCPDVIPLNQPVTIEFTVHNRSTSVKAGNNFFAMLFITTTAGYEPLPPDCPAGCDCSHPDTCPYIWGLQATDFEDTDPPMVLTTTHTFTQAGTYYLIAYVDYNDAGPYPFFDVPELVETNNSLTFVAHVGYRRVFLPLVVKGHAPP